MKITYLLVVANKDETKMTGLVRGYAQCGVNDAFGGCDNEVKMTCLMVKARQYKKILIVMKITGLVVLINVVKMTSSADGVNVLKMTGWVVKVNDGKMVGL